MEDACLGSEKVTDDTALYKAYDFADDFVRQSDKQSADDTCVLYHQFVQSTILSATSESYELSLFSLARE